MIARLPAAFGISVVFHLAAIYFAAKNQILQAEIGETAPRLTISIRTENSKGVVKLEALHEGKSNYQTQVSDKSKRSKEMRQPASSIQSDKGKTEQEASRKTEKYNTHSERESSLVPEQRQDIEESSHEDTEPAEISEARNIPLIQPFKRANQFLGAGDPRLDGPKTITGAELPAGDNGATEQSGELVNIESLSLRTFDVDDVVIALLLNDQGRVVSARIQKNSRFIERDLILQQALALMRFTLLPQLSVGETKWVGFVARMKDRDASLDLLP